MVPPAPARPLALDVMGGDRGPAEVVEGVRLALRRGWLAAPLHLVGPPEQLEPILRAQGLAGRADLVVTPASEVIEMEDKPVASLKRKKDASMVRAVELVKTGECRGAISSGNTGALVACGTLKLRPMEGVGKPAIATVIPSRDHHFILIDAGANPFCRPEDLVSNAVLGNAYARMVLGLERPRVGLLSIGTEEGKGNDLTNQAHLLLKSLPEDLLCYQGLCEGLQLFHNQVDVVVCDGFIGNILLKSCESLARAFKGMMRDELTRNPLRQLGALLCRGAFRDLRERVNPDRYGGAPLLGLNGLVLKAHGSSNREAFANALRICTELGARDFLGAVRADLTRLAAGPRPGATGPEIDRG